MLNVLLANLILFWLTLNCILISTVHIVLNVLSILCVKLLFQSYQQVQYKPLPVFFFFRLRVCLALPTLKCQCCLIWSISGLCTLSSVTTPDVLTMRLPLNKLFCVSIENLSTSFKLEYYSAGQIDCLGYLQFFIIRQVSLPSGPSPCLHYFE